MRSLRFVFLQRRQRRLLLLFLLTVRILTLTEDETLEILKANYHASNVVETLAIQAVLEHGLDGETTLLVHRLSRSTARSRRLLPLVPVAAFPDSTSNVLITHLVKDTVTCHDDEVLVLVYLERANLRLGFNHVRVATSIN